MLPKKRFRIASLVVTYGYIKIFHIVIFMYIISRRFHVHFLLHTSSRVSSIHHQLTAWHGHFHIYTAFLSSYDIALYLCTLSSSSTNKETLFIRGYLFICRLAKESLNLCDKTVLSSFIAVALIIFGLSCSCMTVLLQRNFMYWMVNDLLCTGK